LSHVIDRHIAGSDHSARWTNFIDASTQSFEDEMSARHVSLPLPQRHAWLCHAKREFRLLQLRDGAGVAAMQVAVILRRPRLGFVAMAEARKLGYALTPRAEHRALELLCDLLREESAVISLRLLPRRESLVELRNFEERARRAGFRLTEPEDVTRTLLLDITPEPDEIRARLSPKTRAKFRTVYKDRIELRTITDSCFQQRCETALVESFRRTGVVRRYVDLSTDFAVARERPDLARIIGLFLKERPDELLAFAIGHRHGMSATFESGGSYFDPALRKLQFNQLLLWELFLWAREQGSTVFDLGGVTDGGADDPLAGISEFKRHLATEESEVGREMIITLRPVRRWSYDLLRALSDPLRR
jgi:hypothetical protein